MLLLLNTDRALARIAVEARRSGVWGSATRRSTATPPASPAPLFAPETRFQPRSSAHYPGSGFLERTIGLALVGEPDEVGAVLTADARGWSPSLSFSSRQEVMEALRDSTSTLTVADFAVDRLHWSEPFAFAEWHLEARQTEALLIADDLLLAGTDNPVRLVGATVAELRDGQIAQLHTYFDDASLIEQIVVNGAASDNGTS